MGYIAANSFAILAATAAGLLVGAAWHAAFESGRSLSLGFALTALLVEAWLAAILAGALILAPPAGPGPWTMALATAFVIWIGFVLPTVVVTDRHAGASAGTATAHALHWLAVMLVQAGMLQAIGLTKPG